MAEAQHTPLALLRQFISQDKQWTYLDDAGNAVTELDDAKSIRFDGTADDARNTTFQLSQKVWRDYGLADILYYYQNKDVDYRTYFSAVTSRALNPMSIVDTQPLKRYLMGEVDELPGMGSGAAATDSALGKRAASADIDATRPTVSFAETQDKFIKLASTRAHTQHTRDSLLRVPVALPPTFTDIVIESNSVISSMNKKAKRSGDDGATVVSARSEKSARSQRGVDKEKDNCPIIIVPNSTQSMLTLSNVASFLENSVYQPLETTEPTLVSEVFISHRGSDGMTKKYRVVDSMTKFTDDDWNRVVAVFVLGQDWQFKDWKIRDPAIIFHRFRGFYLRYNDDVTPSPIQSWNVHILKINRERRHQDAMTVVEFWKELERWARVG